MHNDQQPSIKTLFAGCLAGCLIIVGAGFGLYQVMGAQDQQASEAELAAARTNGVPAPTTLAVVTPEDKALSLAKRIESMQSNVTAFDVKQHTANLDAVDDALAQFDNWADFIRTGVELPLDNSASYKLNMLNNEVERIQKAALPTLRDQYGPALRADFKAQQQNISAMTVSKGYKTLVFTSAEFKDKANVEKLHLAKQSSLAKLRFTKVIYQTKKRDKNPIVKELGILSDTTVITWAKDQAIGFAANELVFSTENHLPAVVKTANVQDL